LLFRITDIKEAVSSVCHAPPEALLTSRRGIANEPRNIAVYLARRYSGKKLEELGREFNIANYSAVSSVICGIGRQLKTNRHLQRTVDQSRKKLTKGQQQTPFPHFQISAPLTPAHILRRIMC
jgi:chromosomal replication initiation ATPase DnaA